MNYGNPIVLSCASAMAQVMEHVNKKEISLKLRTALLPERGKGRVRESLASVRCISARSPPLPAQCSESGWLT